MTQTAQLDGRQYQLTTDHAASSYGVPVLIGPNGTAYGQQDRVPLPNGNTIAAYALTACVKADNPAEWMQLMSSFIPDLSDTFDGRES